MESCLSSSSESDICTYGTLKIFSQQLNFVFVSNTFGGNGFSSEEINTANINFFVKIKRV